MYLVLTGVGYQDISASVLNYCGHNPGYAIPFIFTNIRLVKILAIFSMMVIRYMTLCAKSNPFVFDFEKKLHIFTASDKTLDAHINPIDFDTHINPTDPNMAIAAHVVFPQTQNKVPVEDQPMIAELRLYKNRKSHYYFKYTSIWVTYKCNCHFQSTFHRFHMSI